MRKLALLYMTFILPFFMFGCGKTKDNEINFSSSSETTEQFSEKTNASGNETVSSETTIELLILFSKAMIFQERQWLTSAHRAAAEFLKVKAI